MYLIRDERAEFLRGIVLLDVDGLVLDQANYDEEYPENEDD